MVRDTQILEKRLVAKELEEEERRLAEMMEVERQKANEMQEELERRRKQELIRRAGGSLTSCRHQELLRPVLGSPVQKGLGEEATKVIQSLEHPL